MKSNAHIVTRNTFFQEANYLNPDNYNDQFNNEICRREDQEIKSILDSNIDINTTITDIGCGTGLGRTLTNNEYIGIDTSERSIEHCRNNYEGTFIHENAETYIDRVEKINPIFLFSIDYISLETIQKYIEKTDQVFIAIHCNKPYKSQTSVYAGKEDTYYHLHPKEEIRARIDLFRAYNDTTYKLLDQDYYYVTVIKKG